MATKNFRSTVLEPTSEFAYGDKLRFTALSSINQVFKRSFSEVTIGVDGVYDIDLQYGKYRIDYKPYEGIWALFANVEVGAETTATSLQDLAMTSSPVTDDTILALQAILAETKVNAENAEKSSIDSIAAATEAAKDRDEIEDLMLRAMTTADVNAIRETNKAVYVASGVDTWGTVGSEPVNPKRGGLNCIDESNILLIDGKYHIAGLTFEIPTNSEVIFPEAPDGTVTYNKSNGVVTQHATPTAAFAVADADVNIEVVVNRVDLNCFEYYLRAVTEADPFVYPNGDIHSQSASMSGVATTLDDVRPDSYFANFTGQTNVIRGKGVNWFTASNAEKLKILSESNEHGYLHYDPDTAEWRQWSLRKRTVAGAGNGDWLNASNASSSVTGMGYSPEALVAPQGMLDTPISVPPSQNGSARYSGMLATTITLQERHLGAWTLDRNSAGHSLDPLKQIAVNGNAYLYTVSMHPRINKAAYHQSHNGMGGQKFAGALMWYQTALGTSLQATVANSDAVIASGRPDNKLYNRIYASGQGGTIDHRMTAYETGTVEVRESVLSEAYAGTYRGKQFLTRTIITTHENTNYSSDIETSYLDLTCDLPNDYNGSTNAKVYILKEGAVLKETKLNIIHWGKATGSEGLLNRKSVLSLNQGDKFLRSPLMNVIITYETNIPVSGDFTQNSVAGSIDKILDAPDLVNGWIGDWIPADYSDTTLKYIDLSYNHKVLSASDCGTMVDGAIFKDNEWAHQGFTPDYLTNEITDDSVTLYPNDDVLLLPHIIFAKQAKVSTRKPILNGSSGKGEVWSNSSHENAIFSESVIGKVTTGSQGNARHAVLETSISAERKFDTVNPTIHSGISLTAPDNNSPAVKVLPYLSATNNQVTICFAATELKYTNANWGDDSKIHFVDGMSTLIDTNGETVLCASHELSMPIGHTKKG